MQELAEEAYKMAVVWEGYSDVPTGRHLSHTLRVYITACGVRAKKLPLSCYFFRKDSHKRVKRD